MTPPPAVGVVIPSRGAAADLWPAVGCALAAGASQVVIAAAPQDLVAAEEIAGRHPTRVQVVANPTGSTPVGLNLGIAGLDTPIVARLDAHARFGVGYLTAAVEVLDRTGAAVVGGLQHPVGETPVQRAVAAAMAHPLGSGGARHRTGGRAGPSETAYLGVFRREWLDRMGGFDERLARNQDYELCHRIRQAGGTVWFSPALSASYRPRGSLLALAAQYHDYGRWKRHVMVTAPSSIRLRQLAAPLLVVVLAAAAGSLRLGSPTVRRWGLAAWGGYLSALLAGSVTATATEPPPLGWRERGLVAASLAVMHLAWGTGFHRGPGREAGRTAQVANASSSSW